MDPEKLLSDEDLDQLLRDVEIPTQIKACLLEIPEWANAKNSERVVLGTRQSLTTGRRPMMWAILAASILVAVGLSLVWLSGHDSNHRLATSPVKADVEVNALGVGAGRIELNAVEAGVAAVAARLQQLELARMHVQLERLKAQQYSQLNSSEIASMIIALSDQTSIPLGGSEETVAQRMAHVLDRFPGSRGATIAEEFLAKQVANQAN